MLNKKTILLIIVFFVSIGALWILYGILSLPLKTEGTVDYSDSNYYIAHAGGGIDGHTYTNSKEALLQSLDRGYKFIELDFSLTSDSQLVCAHGPVVFNKITNGDKCSRNVMPDYSTFKRSRIHNQYTPLTADEVLEIMRDKPFVLLVDYLSDPFVIDDFFSNVKNNVMIETPSLSNYRELDRNGYVPLLTLGDVTLRNMAKYLFCRILCMKPIKYVTVTVNCNKNNLRVLKRLFGVEAFAYTCNREDFLRNYLGKEVDKVYTDNLY